MSKRLWMALGGVALLAGIAQAQAPPTRVQTTDGATSCRPSYTIQVNNGSLTCGSVGGEPAAIINMGTPTATTPWSQVTAGANAQTLTVTGAGTLRPTTGGTIEANDLKSGTVTLTGPTNVGMTAGRMYVGDTAAGSLKVIGILQCDAVTEKLRWNTTSLAWECVTDQGGMTAGQVAVTTNDTTTDVLSNKLDFGNGLQTTIQNPGAAEVYRADIDLRNTASGGTTSSVSGLEFVTGELSLLQGCTANQGVFKNATNTGYECATPAGGGSSAWADLTPGTNSTAGTFIFGGTANFDVQSQMRIPSSTSQPAVERELKIAETGDGTLVNKPQLSFLSGAQTIYVPAPLALPTSDAEVLTYNVATQEYVWKRPNTVGVDATDTPNFLETKLVAGANITLNKIGAVGSRQLEIVASGGSATPGGVDGNIQYNNGGALGGFGTFNDGTNATTLPGALTATQMSATGTGDNDLPSKLNRVGNNIDDDDCTGDQGKSWWDTTDSRHEFCDANQGRPKTLTGGLLSVTVEFPTSITSKIIDRAAYSRTIQAIHCIVGAATTVEITVQKCNANAGACTAVEATMTCGTTDTPNTGAIDDPAISAGSYMRLLIGAIVGSPEQVHVSIQYD